MKRTHQIILCILAVLCSEHRELQAANLADQFLREPKEIPALVKTIEYILAQVEERYLDIIAQKIQGTMSYDSKIFIEFLKNLHPDLIDKNNAKGINQLCKDVEDGELLAFIIKNNLISIIQEKLAEYYIDSHPKIESQYLARLKGVVLDMCRCPEAPVAKRIALIMHAIHKIKKKFMPIDHIIITSFGSGGMGMEYLLASALQFSGYSSITLNLIDLMYTHLEQDTADGMQYKTSAQILATRLHLNTHYCLKSTVDSAHLEAVNLFESGFDYIEACIKNHNLQSTVMIAVDAAFKGMSTPIAKPESLSFSQNINRIEISITLKSGQTRTIFVYVTRYGKPRIYWDRHLLFWKKIRESLMQEIENMNTWIEKKRFSEIGKYRFTFISNMQQILTRHFTEWTGLSSITLHAEYFEDPYATFQELIIDGLQNDGQAYMLGAGILIDLDKELLKKTGGYSVFEKYGDKGKRCILRSAEYIEQQLENSL